ncbi:MAG: hypothetical protein ACLTSX_05650 [Collinsella sp.]
MGMELVAALASVAAAVCAATAIAMQVRAHRELERSRARMDEASEQMARANEALVSVQSVLSQVLTTTQATLNQAASTSIVEQQHFDSQVRAIDQVSSKADEARREIAQNLEQNRGAVEQRPESRSARPSTCSSALFVGITSSSSRQSGPRWMRSSPPPSTTASGLRSNR